MKPLCLTLLAFSLAASATAQDAARYSFDLDVPEGHFSYWAAEGINASGALEVDLAITELRRHRRYAPTFGLHLTGDGGASESGRVSLMLTPTRDRRALNAFLSVLEPGAEESSRTDLPGTFALDDTLTVQIMWSANRSVNLVVDGVGAAVSAPWFVPDQFRASASTGQMKASRLLLRGQPGR